MVQPVPAPDPTASDVNMKILLNGNSQNLKLFNRGKHISWAPNRIGSSKFPNPPIRIGITIKKIIKNACIVTTLLKKDGKLATSLHQVVVGRIRVHRNKTLNEAPIIPIAKANTK